MCVCVLKNRVSLSKCVCVVKNLALMAYISKASPDVPILGAYDNTHTHLKTHT